ncbi:unnamed protein product [Brassica rapa subsp. narinosa]
MVRSIRIWLGEWKKNGNEEWDFIVDPEDYGYGLLISKTATFDMLDQIVRRRYSLSQRTPVVVTYRLPSWMLVPLGNKTPPTTIANTSDLSLILNVRTWLEDLAILVTVGPKGVAEYHFLCRTSFNIGATSYVFDMTATENSRAAYESLVFGDRAAQTERVMNAIFPEEAMLLFHRVSLEMAHADCYRANRNHNTAPVREIIELDNDDDEVMMEGTLEDVVQGITGRTSVMPEQITQAQAPSVFWDVGMDLLNYPTHGPTEGITGEGVENTMRFWQDVANEGFACPEGLHVNDPPGNQNMGVGEPNAATDDNGGGSSTGSTHAPLVPTYIGEQVRTNEMVEEPSAIQLGESACILPTNTEKRAGKALEKTPTEFAEGSKATIHGGREKKGGQRAEQTSSEGSSTEGGCL